MSHIGMGSEACKRCVCAMMSCQSFAGCDLRPREKKTHLETGTDNQFACFALLELIEIYVDAAIASWAISRMHYAGHVGWWCHANWIPSRMQQMNHRWRHRGFKPLAGIFNIPSRFAQIRDSFSGFARIELHFAGELRLWFMESNYLFRNGAGPMGFHEKPHDSARR